MDYGKLAYVKAEELESRLSALLGDTNTGSAVYNVSPLFDFTTGEFLLTETTGSGKITLFCICVLRADSDITGKVRLKVNGLVANEKSVDMKNGEEKEFTFLSLISINATASVSLSCDCDATLVRAQILISGKGVKTAISGAHASVDKCSDGVWAIADSKDNNVCVRLFDEQSATMSQEYFYGAGSSVSLCAGNSGFVLAFVDERSNVFIVFLSPDLQEQKRFFLCKGASDVAVCKNNDGYLCATVSGDRIDGYVFDDGTLCSTAVEIEKTTQAKSINFVTNRVSPMLVVTTDDRSYVKSVAKEQGEREVIALNCVLTIPTSQTA